MDLKFDIKRMSMKSIGQTSVDLLTLEENIVDGYIRIPEFQRPIVWQSDAVEELLDSIVEAYPIGFFLIWESIEELNERNPFHLDLQKRQKGQTKLWLLDGQQRTVALVGSFTDKLYLGRKGNMEYKAFYNLKERKFEVFKVSDLNKKKPKIKIEVHHLPLHDLFHRDERGKLILVKEELALNPILQQKYGERYLSEINYLFLKFSKLTIPIISQRKTLADACRIFERINNTGEPLTVVDLMIAKTYGESFNLRTKLDNLNIEFGSKDFDLKDLTILQSMSACLNKTTARDTMINSAENIKAEWETTSNAIGNAIDFLKREGCKLSEFLPYPIMLAPLSFFYYKTKNKPLNSETRKALLRFFWYGAFSERYAKNQDTMAREDMSKMESLINEDYSVFNYDVQINAKQIKEEEISNSPLAKAILCFYSNNVPRDFSDGSKVEIETTFATTNLRNLHHIFPISILEKKSGEKEYKTHIQPFIHSIVNISLVSKKLNDEILDKNPNVYFPDYEGKNNIFKESLDSHFISGLKEFGLLDDSFILFLDKRSELIASRINSLIQELKPIIPS